VLTVADWNSFPEDGLLRHEIIGGEHYTQRGATPTSFTSRHTLAKFWTTPT